MTHFELWGPWTGSALNPVTRRTWLKHRWAFRAAVIALIAFSIIASGVMLLATVRADRAGCTDPNRVHAWEGVCR